MNWDVIGAIAELIGAVAVVVSIIYLARQVRQGVNSIDNATFSETATSWREVLELTTQYTEEFLSGLTQYTSMPPVKKWKFSSVMHGQMSNFENFHLKRQKGWLDEEQAERWRQLLIWYLSWPGVEQWWEQFSQIYTVQFQKHVSEIRKGLEDGSIPKPDLGGFGLDDVTQQGVQPAT